MRISARGAGDEERSRNGGIRSYEEDHHFNSLGPGGLIVFVSGSPYYRIFPTNWNQTYYVAITLVFLRDESGPLRFIALDKLSQFLHIVPVILVLTLAAKDDLRSLDIQKRRLKQGLAFGLVVFGLGCAGAYAMLKDDSLIGPVLFHAGYDLMILVPVLESL